jgi:serine/threonine protein phosphatase PrpC
MTENNKHTVFYDNQRAGPELFELSDCRLAAFTARSPDKTTSNEDCAAWFALDEKRAVFIVADGLGGLPSGEEASRLAIETILSELSQCTLEDDLRSVILHGIDLANEAILNTGKGAATTLAMVELDDNKIRPYHVGDSIILVVGQRGRIKYQSVPHSPTGYAVESGILDEDDAMNHHERHLVSNVLGSHEMRVEIGPKTTLSRFDTILVASDGLADNVRVDQIIEIMRKGALIDCSRKLVTLCHQNMSGAVEEQPYHPDDLTMLLARRFR